MTLHDHLVIAHLTCHVPHTRSTHFRPRPAEDGACGQGEHQIEERVERVVEKDRERRGGRNVVGDPANRDGVLRRAIRRCNGPLADEFDEGRVRRLIVEHLGNEVDVRNEGSLEDDGHVGCIEQFDGVGTFHSTRFLKFDGQVDPPPLHVNAGDEDETRCHQAGEIWKVLTQQRLAECLELIPPHEDEVEEGEAGSLEFGPPPGIDGDRAESLPYDGLADVRCDEETDPRPQSISLLEHLVQHEQYPASGGQLGHDEH